MKILSLKICDGLSEKEFHFGENINLVHSVSNTVGKTTLLRLLLHALGFSIPSTKGFDFEKCTTICKITTERHGAVELTRDHRSVLTFRTDADKKIYVLPDQLTELRGELFSCNNEDIAGNLLGVIYCDQEKGWTLLNRGKVIGSNSFNIEALIRGISDVNCQEELLFLKNLERDVSRLQGIMSVSKLQQKLQNDSGAIAPKTYEEEVDSELAKLSILKSSFEKEIKSLDVALSDNKKMRNFIDKMKIMVKDSDGKIILVDSSNVVGLEETIDYLVAQRRYLAARLHAVNVQISQSQKSLVNEQQQMEFWSKESIIESYERSILNVPISAESINESLAAKKSEISRVKKHISELTRSNSKVIFSLHGNVVKYAKMLGLASEGEEIASSFLFTSNLKVLSGALLHKTVFAFRLAYILEVEKKLGIKLPIILDSPKGKEVDEKNVETMMQILKSDFADHQIIIASIYDYGIKKSDTIEIESRLLPLKEKK